ncbi:hypothetical protein JXB02_01640 [Candidatus Woesearchaeota archaeon]|nr:hypothetical protein [Candidatus Woesearchaeota archaeon]
METGDHIIRNTCIEALCWSEGAAPAVYFGDGSTAVVGIYLPAQLEHHVTVHHFGIMMGTEPQRIRLLVEDYLAARTPLPVAGQAAMQEPVVGGIRSGMRAILSDAAPLFVDDASYIAKYIMLPFERGLPPSFWLRVDDPDIRRAYAHQQNEFFAMNFLVRDALIYDVYRRRLVGRKRPLRK